MEMTIQLIFYQTLLTNSVIKEKFYWSKHPDDAYAWPDSSLSNETNEPTSDFHMIFFRLPTHSHALVILIVGIENSTSKNREREWYVTLAAVAI